MASESVVRGPAKARCAEKLDNQPIALGVWIELRGAQGQKMGGEWKLEETCNIMTKTQFETLGNKARMEPCREYHDIGTDSHKCFGTFTPHAIRYSGEQRFLDATFCIVDALRKPPILLTGQKLQPRGRPVAAPGQVGRVQPGRAAKSIQPITISKESKEDRKKREAREAADEADKPEDAEDRVKRRKKRHEQEGAVVAAKSSAS